MKDRWKVWVAAIALVQLLVIGVDVVLLWPMPSEAEQVAECIREGMTDEQWAELRSRHLSGFVASHGISSENFYFDDGSHLHVGKLNHFPDLAIPLDPGRGTWPMPKQPQPVPLPYSEILSIDASTAETVPPLTRLRRTLARILSDLKE
jgi:hypothetical protein